MAKASSNILDDPSPIMVGNPTSSAQLSSTEMAEHFELCMKLAAENKITTKNAFGLHLIDYMKQLVCTDGMTDLQSAGMSIGVSAKIYALRVDCLFKETHRFHGFLQAITTNKNKPGFKPSDSDISFADDDPESGKQKGKKQSSRNKSKSYVVSEETVTSRVEAGASRIYGPHKNFSEINSAFDTSRNVAKLLYRLKTINDLSEISFSAPQPIICTQNIAQNSPFKIHLGFYDSLKAILKFDPASEKAEDMPSFFNATASRQITELDIAEPLNDEDAIMDVSCWNPGNGDDDDDDIDEVPELPQKQEGINKEINSLMYQVSNLNITSAEFVHGVTQAVTQDGNLNETLINCNSVLRKLKVKKNPEKKKVPKRVLKNEEPLFDEKDPEMLQSKFSTGKRHLLTEEKLNSWHTNDITFPHEHLFDVLQITSNDAQDQSHTDLEDNDNHLQESQEEKERKRLLKINHVLIQYCKPLSHYFHKFSLKFPGTGIANNESVLMNGNGNNNDENMNLNNDEEVIYRDRNKTTIGFASPLYDAISPVMSDDDDGHADPFDEQGDALVDSVSNLNEQLQNKCWIDDQIKDLLVPKPFIVKPPNMNFDTKLKYVDTERAKGKLWHLLQITQKKTRESHILLSKMYPKLKKAMGNEGKNLSVGLSFVFLLILSNEHNLSLAQRDDCKDIVITLPELK